MTDEEILDCVVEMADLDEIHRFIRDHRQIGWKRRFFDSDAWMRRHGHQVEELKRPKFGKAKKL